MKTLVLLVTDKPEIGQVWSYVLQQRGIDCVITESAAQAEAYWVERMPNLALIDVYTHQLHVIELCRKLHAQTSNPILMLSSYADESSILTAYAAGVDEYIPRPISPAVFIAKVQSWLRRSWTVPIDLLAALQLGSLRLEPQGRRLLPAEGRAVRLTSLEYRLLHTLMSYPRRPFPVDVLVERVWGYGGGDSIALKNVVYRLRRKIEPDPSRPRYVQTLDNGGYIFYPD